MTEDTNHDPLDDDQEMLDAIAAAFGPDAVDFAQDSIEPGEGSGSLHEMVAEIDASLTESNAADNDPSVCDADDTLEQFILVEVGGSRFGLPMCNVLEIQRVPQITYLPNVPTWVRGVVNLRGTVLSVAELQTILRMPKANGSQSHQRMIVTQSLLDEIDTGLVVDRVLGVRNIPKNRIEEPTAPINDQLEAYLLGVHVLEGEIVCLLDIEKLLLSESFRQFETTQ